MRIVCNKGSCASCYYGDKCPDEKTCEFYDPLDFYEVLLKEYSFDLKIRDRAYAKITKELGGEDY